jgi:hypothetical protein
MSPHKQPRESASCSASLTGPELEQSKTPVLTTNAGRTSEKRSMIDFESLPQTVQLTKSRRAARDNPIYRELVAGIRAARGKSGNVCYHCRL